VTGQYTLDETERAVQERVAGLPVDHDAMAAIANLYRAGISKSTLTGVASTLEARGLLERRPYPDDGRRVLLSLTPAAESLMAELFPRLNAQEQYVVQSLSPTEVVELAGGLRRIVRHLEGGSVTERPSAPARRSRS